MAKSDLQPDPDQAVVLVIDDDDEILHSIRRILTHEGFVVLISNDPIEGIKLYGRHHSEIKVVVLDYFMHILRGDAVLERLQQINPQVRVVLTTACEEDVSEKMRQSGLCGYVQKPLSPRDLVENVRNALNHHADNPPEKPDRPKSS